MTNKERQYRDYLIWQKAYLPESGPTISRETWEAEYDAHKTLLVSQKFNGLTAFEIRDRMPNIAASRMHACLQDAVGEGLLYEFEGRYYREKHGHLYVVSYDIPGKLSGHTDIFTRRRWEPGTACEVAREIRDRYRECEGAVPTITSIYYAGIHPCG